MELVYHESRDVAAPKNGVFTLVIGTNLPQYFSNKGHKNVYYICENFRLFSSCFAPCAKHTFLLISPLTF